MAVSGTTLSKPALDLSEVNRRLDDADATRIIRWAAETFGSGLVMTSSFGAQSAVMLHLATQVIPDIPVVFIDTGYLFPETYRFVDELTRRMKLNLKVYQPSVSAARMEAIHGKLWEQGEEGHRRYGYLTKKQPMQRAIEELKVTAWLAGLRARQTDFRAALRTVEQQEGLYKIHPILKWTGRQEHEYMKQHDLPYHPLWEKGYASIGDVHSTRPVGSSEDERSGRFGGLKQECGLHLPQTSEENQSREASGL